jgi:hypothetical protein
LKFVSVPKPAQVDRVGLLDPALVVKRMKTIDCLGVRAGQRGLIPVDDV